jgi:hypothetical protein
MSVDARAQLAAAQAGLVAALVAGGAAPPGFDCRRLEAAAASLAAKRARAAARAWPVLAGALGARFAVEFAAFAAAVPQPRHGGPLADGRAFARWLAEAGTLPDAVRPQLLAVDLRYAGSADGLRPRRAPCLKVALLRRPCRLVLGVWLPWLGARWLTIPPRRLP